MQLILLTFVKKIFSLDFLKDYKRLSNEGKWCGIFIDRRNLAIRWGGWELTHIDMRRRKIELESSTFEDINTFLIIKLRVLNIETVIAF